MSLPHSKKITSKTVGEFFKVVGGGTPTTANLDFWKGSIPWVTSADLGNDLEITPRKAVSSEAIASSATNLVPAGSVIVATRVGLGKVGIAATALCFSQDCQGVILDSKTCDSKFIAHQLKQHVQIFKHISRGTTIAGVTKKQLLDLQFDLPSLDEQKQIVAEIEKQFTRLDAGVAALKRVQANLKRYRAAVLKAACEGKLVPPEAELARAEGRTYEPADQLLARILTERRKKWNGKGKYKEPAAPDTSSLPELPEGWIWATLDQLCPLFADSAHRTPKYGEIGYPALGPRDVVGGKLNLENARLVNESEFNIQTARHTPQPGDIVYSRELSLGWGAIIPDGQLLCMSQGMCLFRPHEDIKFYYFFMMLNGPVGRKHAESAATGSAHPHINLGDIKAYVFPLPPFNEQSRIVAEVERRLSVVEELKTMVDANLQRATRLRQAILQKAFSGGFN